MNTSNNASKSTFGKLVRPIAAATMALSMTLFMGCNDNDTTGESDAVTSDATQSIKIATEGAYPPFNAVDNEGNLIGFDVDLVNALCDEMKAKCEVVAQDWDGIIPGLKAGKYDAIIAGMSITEDRAEQVDFTDPYFENSLVFITKKDSNINPDDRSSLEDLTIATQRTTVAADWLKENVPNAEAALHETMTNAFLDLEAGRVDAILSDKAPAVDWLSKGNTDYTLTGTEIDIDDNIGIAVRKGEDDLKGKFNTALSTLKGNGTYDKIVEKHFVIEDK